MKRSYMILQQQIQTEANEHDIFFKTNIKVILVKVTHSYIVEVAFLRKLLEIYFES